jgi:diadenosine tetraphosphate (Ap4A) HIT family hydrolase
VSGGTAWREPSRWERLKEADSCPICNEGAPQDVIAELAGTWITAAVEAPLPGYACVVSKQHVVEPFELAPRERAAFWREAMLAARVLHELSRPAKMNYEIHGNTVPHLHMHLFPRFADDPYVGGSIDPRRASFTRSVSELERMRLAFASVAASAPGNGA